MFKNIDKQAKLCLKDLVDYRDGQIVSRTLVQNNFVSMTLFSLCPFLCFLSIKMKKFQHTLPVETLW